MEGLIIFISNLTQLLTVVSVILISGWYLNGKKELTYKSSFSYLFIGIVAFSALFAIYKTGGKTVMLGYIIILFGLFRAMRKDKSQLATPPVHVLIPISAGILVGIFFTFTWCFLKVIQFDSFPYHVPSGTDIQQNDYLINVLRSFYLSYTGEENYYHVYNQIDTEYNGTKPYHYLEMWTPAALTSLFGGLISQKFVLISNPLYLLLSFLGIMALWERYVQIRWYHLVLTCLAFFTAGLYLPFYKMQGIQDFSLPIFTYRIKMFVYYPFIFGFLIYILEKNWTISILFLCALMLATIVAAPAILGGFLLMLFLHFLLKREFRTVLNASLYMAAIVAFIFIFYKITDTGNFNIRANAGIGELLKNLFEGSFSTAIDKSTLLLSIILKEFILYLPLVFFVAIFMWKAKYSLKTHQNLFILSAGILLSSAIAYVFFEPQKDANQLFYNISNTLLNCLSILAAIYLISHREKLSPRINLSVILICVLVCSLNSYKALKRNIYPGLSQKNYSNSYLEDIKTYVQSTPEINIGAALKGGTDYKSSFSNQTAAYTLGYYLRWMENGAVALNISDYDTPDPLEAEKEEMSSNLFYRFVLQEKESDRFLSIGRSQVEFIKKHQLDFIILSGNGLLRDELTSYIKQEFIDSESQERFIILDQSKF